MQQETEKFSEWLHLRITPTWRERLDQRCAERGVGLSTLAREALANGLEELQNTEERDDDEN